MADDNAPSQQAGQSFLDFQTGTEVLLDHRRSSSIASSVGSDGSSFYYNSPYGRSSGMHPSSRSGSVSSLDTSPGSTTSFSFEACMQGGQTQTGPSRTSRSRAASLQSPYPLRQSSSTESFAEQLQEQVVSPAQSWHGSGSVAPWQITSPTYPQQQYPQMNPYPQSHRPAPLRRPSDGSLLAHALSNKMSFQPQQSPESPFSQHQRSPSTPGETSTISIDTALASAAAQITSARGQNHADKARNMFVQTWLTGNYIYWADGNVARQGLYASYSRACTNHNLTPINPASFGKAIRASFPSIKTRRLGVRGNSRYHCGYFCLETCRGLAHISNTDCGMRPSNQRELHLLAQLSANPDTADLSSQPSSSTEEEFTVNSLQTAPSESLFALDYDKNAYESPNSVPETSTSVSTHHFVDPAPTNTSSGNSGQLLPGYPTCSLFVASCPPDQMAVAAEVWRKALAFSRSFVSAVRNRNLEQIPDILNSVYAELTPEERRLIDQPTALANLLLKCDVATFNESLNILVNENQTSPLPPQESKAFQVLARDLEEYTIVATRGFSSSFVNCKVELASRFAHLLARALGLRQLLQAFSSILAAPEQIGRMRAAAEQIDVEHIRNHCALAIGLQPDIFQSFVETFLSVLSNKTKPPTMIEWANSMTDSLGSRSGGDITQISFVLNQFIRDLTLRSDPAFGSFQIMSLFLQDWLGFKTLRSALQSENVEASTQAELLPPASTTFLQPPLAGEAGPQYISFNHTFNTSLATPLANSNRFSQETVHPFALSPIRLDSGWNADQSKHGELSPTFPSSATRFSFEYPYTSN